MRLKYVFLATVVGLLASCGGVAAMDPSSKTIFANPLVSGESISTQQKESTRRLLRASEITDAIEDDEERGWKSIAEAARKAKYKVQFPVWLAKGKTPTEVASEYLKMTYPLIDHRNWKIYKSYKKVYDKLQRSLHPGT
ncbi:Secreted RxLR effector peptide protein [Phytophthora palmivora]|uniref:RxLR effector protein n=1 Tax=Phytophthora palmivora TaxID=4796 RepID=A0A2P4X4L9_9STRA|nr:Secreted RxLR effector peptide protein [Phytophthora palmivora]